MRYQVQDSIVVLTVWVGDIVGDAIGLWAEGESDGLRVGDTVGCAVGDTEGGRGHKSSTLSQAVSRIQSI